MFRLIGRSWSVRSSQSTLSLQCQRQSMLFRRSLKVISVKSNGRTRKRDTTSTKQPSPNTKIKKSDKNASIDVNDANYNPHPIDMREYEAVVYSEPAFVNESSPNSQIDDDHLPLNNSHSFDINADIDSSENESKKKNDLKNKKHVLLIDGQPVAFRSYYTIPTNFQSRGKQVNALFGYARILLKLLKDHGADGVPGAKNIFVDRPAVTHVAVLLDSPGKTFRHNLDTEYKSQRPELPDEFRAQLKLLPAASEAFNVSTMTQPHFEADDLIATYATAASHAGHLVTIVSSDKDLMQLVDENISQYDPIKKELYGVNEVVKKFGVYPWQLVDVQALAGDSVDNVKGVPGIGVKTAAKLIAEFGSLEQLYASLDKVPQKARRAALENHKDSALLSRKLVRLDRHAPTSQPLDALEYKFHLQRFIDYLEPFGFKSTIALVLKDAAADRLAKRESEKHIEIAQAFGEVSVRDNVRSVDDGGNGVSLTEAGEVLEMSDEDMAARCPRGVTLVRDTAAAKRVVEKLLTLTHNDDGSRRYHACDTEAIEVDVKKEGPIGHGKVICFTIYCGPDVDFGCGPCLFVDVLGERGTEIFNVFRPYFEDTRIWKVWHNYGFDRHMMGNHNINVRGFGGDTMHMARLWDAARLFGGGGYSLEGLTRELLNRQKTSMTEIFGVKRILQDGTEGSEVIMPELDYLQRSKTHIYNWIDYAAYDAESTWLLRNELEKRLKAMPWKWPDDELDVDHSQLWVWKDNFTSFEPVKGASMFDLYIDYWRPYAELLTDMEKRGIWLDRERLAAITPIAWNDRDEARRAFLEWACRYSPDAVHMNVDSDVQKRQLFFAPCKNKKDKTQTLPQTKEFKRENHEGFVEEGKKKPMKHVSFTLEGLGLPCLEYTAAGWPRASSTVLRKLAGSAKTGQYGKAYLPFSKLYGDDEAVDACIAIEQLCDAGAISTLLSTFIEPLQSMADENGRLHTSININTETGRLSSRRPNLQNQPALEKDRYQIRKCFAAEEGNVLIVADYGQLELRLLAHMSRCKSMIDAFATGGDFHSRTAVGMYPEIAKEVEKGDLLLEWDASKGVAPAPVLKDKYSMERRRAKTLNFSIAYGKTARGLAIDWETSVAEAKETVDRWYADRWEVKAWQEETIRRAALTGYTKTLMGRLRRLPGIRSKRRGERTHAERAAINTPLQGGAADIVMAAMLRIEQDELLRKMGYKQLLQVHDELILEGPEQFADEALARVVELMTKPINRELLIELPVDAEYAKTWGDAK